MALNFTFLREEQIWGDGNRKVQLDVMKRYGTRVAPTDLTVLLGGYMGASNHYTSEGDLTCVSWTASSYANGSHVGSVERDGERHFRRSDARIFSARPALPLSEVSMIHPKNIHEGPNGVQIGEYGEYPQIVADDRTGERLEKLHESGSLCSTGKNYTFDSVDIHNNGTPFKAIPYTEYELDGKRFIRVLARPAYRTSYLSTGEQVEVDKPYWVQVKPIEWLMDRSGIMVAKKCLFAGIQVDTADRPNGDFAKTFMKHYLDTYFAKEMEPTVLMPRREASKNRTESDKKGSIKCKTSGKKQQGLLSLLRSNQPATVIKKATKKTIAKNCRSKNSKTSEL